MNPVPDVKVYDIPLYKLAYYTDVKAGKKSWWS
jgi:hypothetical protein